MIHLIQLAGKEGGFRWIEILQRNPSLNSCDPPDPSDPSGFQVCSQLSITSDQEGETHMFPKGIDQIWLDQADQVDQANEINGLRRLVRWIARGSGGSRPHAGRAKVLPRGGRRGERGAPSHRRVKRICCED